MAPVLTTAVDVLTRVLLHRRGVKSSKVRTSLGRLRVFDGPGDGTLPPIVLVHGLAASSASYAPVIVRLLPHVRRVIAIDLPGHGGSVDAPRAPMSIDGIADAVTEALDRVLLEPAIVCGNSLGGLMALEYARRRPDRVRGLVLLSPGAAPMSEDEIVAVRKAFHLPTRADARAFIERLYHRMPPIAALFAGDTREAIMSDVVQGILATVRPDHAIAAEHVRALAMPILFVWGRSERLLPKSGLAYFREHLPAHALVEEPEGLGHCPQLDDPAWVARRIVELARRA
jgi:pimeloyl-ACP methyl ester carboxylesterase